HAHRQGFGPRCGDEHRHAHLIEALNERQCHPLARPGMISGRVTRTSTAQPEAPSDTAACSSERSPAAPDASVRRKAKGSTMTTCARPRPRKLLASPISEKKRRKAIPSTTCGIIRGDINNAVSASRPQKA